MSQTLAVKYRPMTFEDVCGQSITVKILRKAVEQKSFKHAYLFAGDSGCGKTTLARCFANAINQNIGSPIEIDGTAIAGNDEGGANAVRELVAAANQRALDAEYKIYIIDECHILSKAAWNAFLKGIEEPPEYTIFIFCTTEPNRVPDTILNRVQRFNITKIDSATIKDRLVKICISENFTNYEQACDLISKIANGCMREAITKLEKCANFSTDLSMENVKLILTDISYEAMFKLTWALQDKNEGQILEVIDKLYSSGNDLKNFISTYLEFVIDLSKYILFKNISLTAIPSYFATTENPVVQQTIQIEDSLNWFKKLADLLLVIKSEIRFDLTYKSTIEAYLLRACR